MLLKHHGEDAPIEAAMRADAMLDKGDLDGYAVWRRILRAVEELREGPGTWVCIEARSRGWIFLMYRNSNVRCWRQSGSQFRTVGCLLVAMNGHCNVIGWEPSTASGSDIRHSLKVHGFCRRSRLIFPISLASSVSTV